MLELRTGLWVILHVAGVVTLSSRSPLEGADDPGRTGEALKVKKVTRLTPPQVAGNVTDRFYCVHDAFNSDSTRMAFFENPTTLVTGNLYTDFRGMVWGKVDELKSWTNLKEYLAVAHPMDVSAIGQPYPAQKEIGFAYPFSWSPIPGEANVIYAVLWRTRMLVRHDTDTGSTTHIVSVAAPASDDAHPAELMGWTRDQHLVVHVQNDGGQETRWSAGCYEIDVRMKRRTFHASAWFPMGRSGWPVVSNHGHGAGSPDFTMYYSTCGVLSNYDNPWFCDPNGRPKNVGNNVIAIYPEKYFDPPRAMWYASWTASNGWWITSDPGLTFGRSWPPPTAPYIDSFGISQFTKEGAVRLLYTHASAGYDWNGEGAANWDLLLMPNLAKDGKKVVFTTTDGNYSNFDHQSRGVEPYGNEAVFLAELVPDDGHPVDRTPPSMPGDLTASSVAPGHNKLTWTPSLDDCGVAGYSIFRDGRMIAVVKRGTEYDDAFNLKSAQTYQYSVSAFDAMANASERTAPKGVKAR
jgi:hypothetical protein